MESRVSLEKAKQCLREKPSEGNALGGTLFSESNNKRSNESVEESISLPEPAISSSVAVGNEHHAAAIISPPLSSGTVSSQISQSVPSILTTSGNVPTTTVPIDARLLLFQSAPFALQQQQPLFPTATYLPVNQSFNIPFGLTTVVPDMYTSAATGLSSQERLNRLRCSVNAVASANTASQMTQAVPQLDITRFQDSLNIYSASTSPEPRQMDVNDRRKEDQRTMETEEADRKVAATESEKEDDVAAFLLSSLAVSDRPIITEEEEALEKATLSDLEKANILADTFGSYCSQGVRYNKKARKDLDQESLSFLVRLMRAELDNIPLKEKSALVEAQAKARPEEFSDTRLEKFLRCEGMNTKVRYDSIVEELNVNETRRLTPLSHSIINL